MILSSVGGAVSKAQTPPSLSTLISARAYGVITRERQIMNSVRVDHPQKNKNSESLKSVTFSSSFSTHGSVTQAQAAITDFGRYSDWIPVIDRSEYNPNTQQVEISGAVLGQRVKSTLRILRQDPGWVEFEIVQGDLKGLQATVRFEKNPERDRYPLRKVLVAFVGHVETEEKLPPDFLTENGGAIALQSSAGQMRKAIESRIVIETGVVRDTPIEPAHQREGI